MSNNYDNWERLVEAVLDREHLRQLALISSREPSSCSVSSSISGWSTPIRDDQNIQLGSSSSSTVNETDWERLLPPDYEEIISRSVNPVAYATKEDLYKSLCSSPILLDGGKMSFHIDKTTGKKCYMIGPTELHDGRFNDTRFGQYRILRPHKASRFSKVAKFTSHLYVDIRGEIETQMLSPKTRYAAFLIYSLESYSKNLQSAKGIIKFVNLDKDHDAERRATTIQFRPVSRPDGWMELQLEMFYNDLGSDGPVEVRLLKNEFKLNLFIEGTEPVEVPLLKSDNKSKIDLCIEGIEFRPTTNANQRKGIFSKLRISK